MRAPGPAALAGAAGLMAALGAALWVMPPRLPDPVVPPPPAPAPAAAPDPSTQAAAILSYEEIVRANVFAPDRSAPPRRFVPPHLAAAPRAAAAPAPPTIRLYGVAVGERGAVALIDADPAVPGAEIYRPGDAVAAYRLESIADTFVVLIGPGGRRVITLDAPRRRSP